MFALLKEICNFAAAKRNRRLMHLNGTLYWLCLERWRF